MPSAKTVIFLGLAGFVGYNIATGPQQSTRPSSPAAKSLPYTSAAAECADSAACEDANRKAYASTVEREKNRFSWQYQEHADAMRGTTSKFASLRSQTVLSLSFPYQGGSAVDLTVRKSPSGTDVLLRVTKGQFTCGFSGSSVSVKFDKGKVQQFSCLPPADGSSDVIFITPAPRFVAALKTSKTLIIEAPFYQHGGQQISFTTEGLNWQ